MAGGVLGYCSLFLSGIEKAKNKRPWRKQRSSGIRGELACRQTGEGAEWLWGRGRSLWPFLDPQALTLGRRPWCTRRHLLSWSRRIEVVSW